ncbi:hypothetical protein SAMN04489723_10949 [Algoriphagus aquimarinus]|uniref:Adenylosuccinate synthetase n=1 Tax=Algoriphagus aquimarinus TaxID=237018 RepID=A0A1I1AS74_9BACT|nr:hypothetical protein SAMN04489723_10949 [Algoriphagus aquimarinus]
MTMNNYKRYLSTTSSVLLLLLSIPSFVYSQIPKDIPKPTGPIDFSETSNVVIFLVIPALILVVYLIFRRRIRKVKKDKNEKLR